MLSATERVVDVQHQVLAYAGRMQNKGGKLFPPYNILFLNSPIAYTGKYIPSALGLVWKKQFTSSP